jgi:hypothetical protein
LPMLAWPPRWFAPRLWFSPMTIDGAYTSNDPKCRSTRSSGRCGALTSPTTSAQT